MDESDDFDVDWCERFEGLKEDWEVVARVLPAGWQEAARVTGALRRARGFKDAASLLRVMLIHLVDGARRRYEPERVIWLLYRMWPCWAGYVAVANGFAGWASS